MLSKIVPTTAFLFAASAAAECTRESLLANAAAYVEAQTAGDPSLLSLADDFTYMENMLTGDASAGLLGQTLEIDLSRSTADIVECASYTMFISTAGPYVVSTQIRYPDGDSEAGIAMIDSVVATTGDLFFDAQQTLDYILEEDWSDLEEGQRSSREELKRVGDAYLDMWTDADAADSINWGTECERVEGSMFTEPCGATLPRGGSSTANGNRRYVIDEVVGSVDVLCTFDSLGDWPDSHEIRLVDGLVKYVHTVTVM